MLSKKEMVFSFVDPTQRFEKTKTSTSGKHQTCRFLFPKKVTQNVAAPFLLQTCLTAYTILFQCVDEDKFSSSTIPPGQ